MICIAGMIIGVGLLLGQRSQGRFLTLDQLWIKADRVTTVDKWRVFIIVFIVFAQTAVNTVTYVTVLLPSTVIVHDIN